MVPFLTNLQNIDLLSVGIAVAGMIVLGFAVLFHNLKSDSNRVFFSLAITAGIWGVINYLSYQQNSPDVSFWLLRFVMFCAIWSSFFVFTFANIFPETSVKFPRYYKWGVLPLTVVTALLTLTPFVFARVAEFVDGRITQVANGPGILLFGVTVVFLNLGSIVLLIRKIRTAEQSYKRSLQTVLAGIILMLFLIITFNFVLPAFFGNTTFIPLGALFLFPFIAFTSYAILRHNLFNIRVAGTAVLVFALSVVTFLEIIFARDIPLLIYRSSLFLLVLGFGILLIKGVLTEVRQREQLQKLSQDLAQANTELRRLDAAKSEFVSIASHQLRTPLTAMKGYLSLMLDGTYGALAEKMQKPIHNVYDSNQRLIRLVNDLLSLSRIESGKMELDQKPTSIVEIAESVIGELELKAKEKNLSLVLQKPVAPLPAISIDEEKIRNVILNLIDNSIRYTKQGSVTTKIEQIGKVARVTIQDTGEGMEKGEVEKLFASFSRGQAGKRLATEGMGLGLYIARQFVEMHKGKIWAESEGKGKGSTFHIELPVR